MINLGARNFTDGFKFACYSNNFDITDLLLEYKPSILENINPNPLYYNEKAIKSKIEIYNYHNYK